jgi:hypothetical protein
VDYKVNVRILGKTPGQIITPKDKNYERFAYWAKRKDKKSGMIICEEAKAEQPKVNKKPEKMNKTELAALIKEKHGIEVVIDDHTQKQLVEMVENPPKKEDGSGEGNEPTGGKDSEDNKTTEAGSGSEDGTSDNEKQSGDTGE